MAHARTISAVMSDLTETREQLDAARRTMVKVYLLAKGSVPGDKDQIAALVVEAFAPLTADQFIALTERAGR